MGDLDLSLVVTRLSCGQCWAALYYYDQVFTDLENFGQKKYKKNLKIQKKKFWVSWLWHVTEHLVIIVHVQYLRNHLLWLPYECVNSLEFVLIHDSKDDHSIVNNAVKDNLFDLSKVFYT